MIEEKAKAIRYQRKRKNIYRPNRQAILEFIESNFPDILCYQKEMLADILYGKKIIFRRERM